ncbi:MAG: hypothetical protein ACRC5Q_00770, partial [Culicoidibacterales bacterium]
MIELIATVGMFFCSITIFWYAGKVFTKPVKTQAIWLIAFINAIIYYVYLQSGQMLHISVVMFLVVVILFFEFRYTFDSD